MSIVLQKRKERRNKTYSRKSRVIYYMKLVLFVLISSVFVLVVGASCCSVSTCLQSEIIEFRVKDRAGDEMIIQVNSTRQTVVTTLVEILKTGERKWVGGEIESWNNSFGFRFKPATIIVSDLTAEGLQAVNYKSIQQNFTYWRGLGTVYISGKVLDILLSKEDAIFRVETNRDFIIFWAVLFFTCVVGIIELLSLFVKEEQKRRNKALLILYLFLLLGINLSINSAFNTYRESAKLTRSGELGEGYKHYVEAHPTLTEYIILTWWDKPLEFGLAIFINIIFCSLLASKLLVEEPEKKYIVSGTILIGILPLIFGHTLTTTSSLMLAVVIAIVVLVIALAILWIGRSVKDKLNTRYIV